MSLESDGFQFLLDHHPGVTEIAFNGKTATGLRTSVHQSRAMKDPGFLPEADCMVRLWKTDRAWLGIVDRSEPVVAGVKFRVLKISVHADETDTLALEIAR